MVLGSEDENEKEERRGASTLGCNVTCQDPIQRGQTGSAG